MQLIEHSLLGLRSARHVLESPDHAARVVLYPMIHIGAPSFYEDVRREAAKADTVIHEGIRSPIVRRITRAYRWIGPRRLGLIVQPRLDFTAGGAKMRSGDLEPAEFEALWRSEPALRRWGFEGVATMVGLWQRLSATRDSIARTAATDLLPNRDDWLAWSPETAGLLSAIGDARDAQLWSVLEDEIGPPPGKEHTVAVVFGALHMRAVLRELDACAGFRAVESSWLEVFSA